MFLSLWRCVSIKPRPSFLSSSCHSILGLFICCTGWAARDCLEYTFFNGSTPFVSIKTSSKGWWWLSSQSTFSSNHPLDITVVCSALGLVSTIVLHPFRSGTHQETSFSSSSQCCSLPIYLCSPTPGGLRIYRPPHAELSKTLCYHYCATFRSVGTDRIRFTWTSRWILGPNQRRRMVCTGGGPQVDTGSSGCQGMGDWKFMAFRRRMDRRRIGRDCRRYGVYRASSL